jgi:CelD/BcsL family acetyltransferase involved in cellulose biosynthesis
MSATVASPVTTPNLAVGDGKQSAHSLTGSLVRSVEQLRLLRSSWNALFERTQCDNAFLSFEWMSAWVDAFLGNSSLFVIVVRDEEGWLRAIAPLYVSRQPRTLGLRCVGLIGDRLVASDHLDFLVDPAYTHEAIDCIVKVLAGCASSWDHMELAGVDESSAAMAAFRNAFKPFGFAIQMLPGSTCPYITLPRTPDAFLASLPTKLRSNVKYYTRSLEREGELELVDVTGSSIPPAFSELVRLHDSRFETKTAASAFSAAGVRDFHTQAAAVLGEANQSHVFLLNLNGTPIAALYGFSVQGRFMFYQSGFEPAYGRFSVGTVLLGLVIRRCIETGHHEFDFLRGNETYKFRWANGSRILTTTCMFSNSSRSLVAKALFVATQWLRRIKKAGAAANSSTDKPATN